MPTASERTAYRNSLIASAPISVQTSSDNVKTEFGPNCKAKYAEVIQDFKYLSQFHDLQAVLDALKQDLGLQ